MEGMGNIFQFYFDCESTVIIIFCYSSQCVALYQVKTELLLLSSDHCKNVLMVTWSHGHTVTETFHRKARKLFSKLKILRKCFGVVLLIIIIFAWAIAVYWMDWYYA